MRGCLRTGAFFSMLLLMAISVAAETSPSADRIASPISGQISDPDSGLVSTQISGKFDWLTGKIRATGVAYPQKKDAQTPPKPSKMLSVAKVVAQQNLLETIRQIPVSSTEQVGTLVGSDPRAMAKIQELIKRAPVINQAYLSDGTLEVVIELGLWGALMQLVLPLEVKPIETVTPITPHLNQGLDSPKTTEWTGLIVDARGVGLRRALVPSIIDDLGDRVYGPEFINRDFAVQWGMCGYVTGLEKSFEIDRIGKKPLMVKALRASGPQRTNIVISSGDAGRIRAIAEHVALFREGRLIVVTD